MVVLVAALVDTDVVANHVAAKVLGTKSMAPVFSARLCSLESLSLTPRWPAFERLKSVTDSASALSCGMLLHWTQLA